MVKDEADYRWSSYHHNALGGEDKLITEHDLYLQLGRDAADRRQAYQALFDRPVNKDQDAAIDSATLKGEVFGRDHFHEKIAKIVGRPTRLIKHGGDRKSQSWLDQAG